MSGASICGTDGERCRKCHIHLLIQMETIMLAGNLISQWKERKAGARSAGEHSWEFTVHTLKRCVKSELWMLLLSMMPSCTHSKETPHWAFCSSDAFNSCMVIALVIRNRFEVTLNHNNFCSPFPFQPEQSVKVDYTLWNNTITHWWLPDLKSRDFMLPACSPTVCTHSLGWKRQEET